MARLIYVFLAFALGTLIAGFLIRDSSIPLFASIGLSALVLVMILFGTSRRLRRDTARDIDETELSELEIVELDEEPAAVEATVVDRPITTPARRKPPSRPRPRIRTDTSITETEDEPTIVVPEPPPARRRARRAEETAPTETVRIEEEEAPQPRRRKPRAAGRPTASSEDTDAVVQPPAIARPPISRKVWVIPGRSRYHTESCRFAKGDQLREVTETTARRRGYVPCNVCRPDQASA